MKMASLIIGILLTILAGIGGVVCLLLPSLTNNRVKFEEALLGLIPSVLVLLLGLVITIVASIWVIKARKNKQLKQA